MPMPAAAPPLRPWDELAACGDADAATDVDEDWLAADVIDELLPADDEEDGELDVVEVAAA